MAQLKNQKIAASTLIEVLIAMVIIMVIFGIAISLFNQVLSSSVSFRKVSVQNELNGMGKMVADKGYVEEEVLLVDSIQYQFSTQATPYTGITELRIEALQRGKPVGQLKRYFKVKQKIEEN